MVLPKLGCFPHSSQTDPTVSSSRRALMRATDSLISDLEGRRRSRRLAASAGKLRSEVHGYLREGNRSAGR
jgi:hypothetical protein